MNRHPQSMHCGPRAIAIGTMALFVLAVGALACGGGWAPMVFTSPTGTQKSDDKPDQKSSFYRVDRGVTYDMFNDKKLQPVIQRILAKGNRRVDRSATDDAGETKSDTTASASTKKTSKTKKTATTKSGTQVLNVKNLH